MPKGFYRLPDVQFDLQQMQEALQEVEALQGVQALKTVEALQALEALEEINTRLRENDVALHLSEVKGPVMDALERSDFLHHLSGEIFLSHHHAVMALRNRETADPALI